MMCRGTLFKVCTIALVAMIVSVGIPVSAASIDFNGNCIVHNEQLSTSSITVHNVKGSDNSGSDSVQVIAYQVYHWDTSLRNWGRNTMFDDVEISDITELTDTEVGNLANVARYKTSNYVRLRVEQSGTYTAEVDPGLYLILVYGSGDRVYNPAIVGVNLGGSGNVDLEARFESSNEAYLKSNVITFKKVIANTDSWDLYSGHSASLDGDNVHGDLIPVQSGGTEVSFRVSSSVPEYSPDMFSNTDIFSSNYIIKDDLHLDDIDRFRGILDLKVFITSAFSDELVPVDSSDYFIKYCTGGVSDLDNLSVSDSSNYADSYVVYFTDVFVQTNGGKGVVIEYDSILTESAGVNFDENKTTAAVLYRIPNANSDNEYGYKEDSTYHYTLASCSLVGGVNDTIDGYDTGVISDDFNKVSTTKGVHQNGIIDNISSFWYDTALSGAEFSLTSSTNGRLYNSISDRYGHLTFKGLDTGSYVLQEVTAPSGYVLNSTDIPTVISASFDFPTGKMLQYSIANNTYTAFKSVSPKKVLDDTIKISNDNPLTIINTKSDELPSTGDTSPTAIWWLLGISFSLALLIYKL